MLNLFWEKKRSNFKKIKDGIKNKKNFLNK
jgi:hypothetical protein